MNRKSAPRRKITSKQLLKNWGGEQYFLIRLECRHIYHRSLKMTPRDFIFCKKCVEDRNG